MKGVAGEKYLPIEVTSPTQKVEIDTPYVTPRFPN